MAEQLARIFGTEEDRVNCPWFFKTGACKSGDHCSRIHNRPIMSQTLLLSHMYPIPPEWMAVAFEEPWDDEMYDKSQLHLEEFYSEVFEELAKYGEIEDMVVLDNCVDHFIGNVYVKFYHEEDAEKALNKLTGRFYRGRLIQVEYTTVSDFREARCRGFHETRCKFGPYCNFFHIRHIPGAIKRRVVREMYAEHPEYLDEKLKKHAKKKEKKTKNRSRSRRKRNRSDSRGPSPRGGGGRGPPLALQDDARGGGREMPDDRGRGGGGPALAIQDRSYEDDGRGRDRDAGPEAPRGRDRDDEPPMDDRRGRGYDDRGRDREQPPPDDRYARDYDAPRGRDREPEGAPNDDRYGRGRERRNDGDGWGGGRNEAPRGRGGRDDEFWGGDREDAPRGRRGRDRDADDRYEADDRYARGYDYDAPRGRERRRDDRYGRDYDAPRDRDYDAPRDGRRDYDRVLD